MKVIYKKLPSRKKECIATIGSFDGIHLGHKFILKKIKKEAKRRGLATLVITFDVLPQQFLSKYMQHSDSKSKRYFAGCLSDLEDKVVFVRSLGIDYLWILKISHPLLKLSAEDFIIYVCRYFKVRKFIVGEDFSFGHFGSGSLSHFKGLAQKYKFDLSVVKRKRKKNKNISSSFIRQLIKRGRIDEASKFLNKQYSLKGVVSKGRGLGTKLGFPTANIHPGEYVVPHKGVYAAYVVIKRKIYLAAVNVGCRPTTTDKQATVIEAHVIDLTKHILGEEIRVVFIKKIRAERKFPDLAKLKDAVQRDIKFITSKYSVPPLKHPQLVG